MHLPKRLTEKCKPLNSIGEITIEKQKNTLPEILAELRHVNWRMNGERVYDLFVPTEYPNGPCEVLPQSLGDIADRIEKKEENLKSSASKSK